MDAPLALSLARHLLEGRAGAGQRRAQIFEVAALTESWSAASAASAPECRSAVARPRDRRIRWPVFLL